MASKNELAILSRMYTKLRRSVFVSEWDNADILAFADPSEIDLRKIMKEVIEICATRDYNAGGHMFCTKNNVVPRYLYTGRLVLDRDHLEGLIQILCVHNNIRPDY